MNARQEAERLWPTMPPPDMLYPRASVRDDHCRRAFEAGAYYATTPDNTEAVEAIAQTLAKVTKEDRPGPFDYDTARAILEALNNLMKGQE